MEVEALLEKDACQTQEELSLTLGVTQQASKLGSIWNEAEKRTHCVHIGAE